MTYVILLIFCSLRDAMLQSILRPARRYALPLFIPNSLRHTVRHPARQVLSYAVRYTENHFCIFALLQSFPRLREAKACLLPSAIIAIVIVA